MSLYRHLGTLLLLLVLIGMGIAKYSQLSPQTQRRLELETSLEQVCNLEQLYFQRHGRYFDPADSSQGMPAHWLQGYRWEARAGRHSFWVLVRADLNEDGIEGIWRVDEHSRQGVVLVED
ncbi:MAG: hypothetical protein FJY95_16075 [Candidatus Handelsmanbacteria bacterium]|nr:hypothetical protein [Candidatus Handelsmanbacteria bacterium]